MTRKVDSLKREMRNAARAAQAAARDAVAGEGKSHTVNTDVRSNIQVRANVGSRGGAQAASASQYAPIHQGPEPD